MSIRYLNFRIMLTWSCKRSVLYLIHIFFQDKKSLKLGPDDHLHVEGFGLNVFAKADKQDRAGRADL